jgi:hypothetical protein
MVLHLSNDVLHLLYVFSIAFIKGKDIMLNYKGLKGGFYYEGLVVFTLK